ncbi:hypothetical protein K2Y11_03630 [bacterium]|nr:hypothetical protein [bacterium]
MTIPSELYSAFPPDANALVDFTRRFVDDQMLKEIANADYGYRVDDYFKALKEIRDSGVMPGSFECWPKEVLELTRWKEPDELEEYEETIRPKPLKHRNAKVRIPISPRMRGHRIRLFACAILLWFAEDDSTVESTLAQALESAKYLGAEANSAFARSLAAAEEKYYSSERWFRVLTLLVLTLRLRVIADERLLREMTEWVLEDESEFSNFRRPSHSGELPPVPFGFGLGYWKSLFDEIAEFAKAVHSEDLREKITLIAQSAFQ